MRRFALVITILVVCLGPAGFAEMRLSWYEENIGDAESPWYMGRLTIHDERFPGGALQVTYPEAYCRSGSTNQPWPVTVIPQRSTLVFQSDDETELHLRSKVGEAVVVDHVIRAGEDQIEFEVTFHNGGKEAIDLEWAQTACLRVGEFTGLGQAEYFTKCFIFTDEGMKMLHELPRETEGFYTPGQVYVPAGIDPDDVNPRPVSDVMPVNALIGAISGDGKSILAIAWEPCQELFQGVAKCIHSDPRVGGLQPDETKRVRGKLYFVPNDPAELLNKYKRDFAPAREDIE